MLVIGAGVIGQAVARRAAGAGHDVTLLVRSGRDGLNAPITQLVGDAREPQFGVGEAVADELRARTTHIVVSVGRPAPVTEMGLAEAYDGHILPSLRVLDFASTCRALEAVILVSSVVVAADAEGPVRSDALPGRVPHRSYYGWAKHEVETLARKSELPCRFVRAGHVIDDGPDAGAKRDPELAAGLRRLLELPILPIATTARYWVTPSSLVADVVLAMCGPSSPEACWAVDPNAPTFAEVLDALAVRHHIRSWRAPAWRGLRPLLRRARGGLRSADYILADFELDLRCLGRLLAGGQVTAPTDRRYLMSALDREVAGISEMTA